MEFHGKPGSSPLDGEPTLRRLNDELESRTARTDGNRPNPGDGGMRGRGRRHAHAAPRSAPPAVPAGDSGERADSGGRDGPAGGNHPRGGAPGEPRERGGGAGPPPPWWGPRSGGRA